MEIKMLKVGVLENRDVMCKLNVHYDTWRIDFVFDTKNFLDSDKIYDMVCDGYNDLSSDDKLDLLENYDSKPSEIIDDIIDDNVREDIITYIETWLEDNGIDYDEVDYCQETEEYYYTDSEDSECLSMTDILKMERTVSDFTFADMFSLYHLIYVHDMENTSNYTMMKIQDTFTKIYDRM